jgi:cephalosporin hydroxylase
MKNENILKEAYDLGMVQNYYEISNALEFVESLNVQNFMEIGTDQGGTFLCWSKVADPKGLKISLDWAHGPWGVSEFDVDKRNQKMMSLGSNVHILNGDSHSEFMYNRVKDIIKDEKLDFLFIDGDHSYLGVKLDYHMYKEFVKPGGWIGFHDIKNTDRHHEANCYVDTFWDELPNKKVWFLTEDDWGGIGFIQVK